MNRSFFIGCLAIGSGLLALGIGLSRSRIVQLPGQRPPLTQEELAFAARQSALPKYEALKMMPAAEITTERDLDQTLGFALQPDLQAALNDSTRALSASALKQLRSEFVGVVYRRWWTPDFEQYDAFMRASGYQLRDGPGLVQWCAIDLTYPQLTGQQWDPSLPATAIAKAVWEAEPPGNGAAAVLKAIPVDNTGTRVAFSRHCPGDPQFYPVPPGPLGKEGWIGESSGAFSRFYVPESGNSLRNQLAQRKCVMLATIGTVMRFRDGQLFPFLFWYWFDEDSNRWRLDKVGVGNATEGFGGIFF